MKANFRRGGIYNLNNTTVKILTIDMNEVKYTFIHDNKMNDRIHPSTVSEMNNFTSKANLLNQSFSGINKFI